MGGRLFAQSKQSWCCWDFINQGEKYRPGLGAGSQAPSAATSWAQPAVLGLWGRIRPWGNPAGCWLWARPSTKGDQRETPALSVPLQGDVCGPPPPVPRLPWARRGAQPGDSGRGGCREPWGQRTSPSQQDPKRCGAIWASSLPYGDKWWAVCARTHLSSTGQHFWCAPSLQEHPAQPQQLPVPLGPAAVLPRHLQPPGRVAQMAPSETGDGGTATSRTLQALSGCNGATAAAMAPAQLHRGLPSFAGPGEAQCPAAGWARPPRDGGNTAGEAKQPPGNQEWGVRGFGV